MLSRAAYTGALLMLAMTSPSCAFMTPTPSTLRSGFASKMADPRPNKLMAGVVASDRRRWAGAANLAMQEGDGPSKADILVSELKEELPQLFDLSYTPKWGLYSDQVKFVDPLNEFSGVEKYKSNIAMLKDSPLFKDSKMDLHEAVVQPDGSVLTRWTLAMTFKAFPWQPRITFTGTSTYFLDANGKVDKHVDMWDSIDDQSPVSFQALSDLISQMLPDITKRGVQAIKGGAAEEITYTVVRRAPGLEIRRFDEFEVVTTEDEGVYSRETYNEARNVLRDYHGDALVKPNNKEKKLLPVTDPLLQQDRGSGLTSLAYVHATSKRGKAPATADKRLRVKSFGNGLVAVKNVRGYGQDRTRGEESVQRGLTELRDAVRREGFQLAAGEEEVFTMANYADGYEIWIRVEATDKSLPVRSAA